MLLGTCHQKLLRLDGYCVRGTLVATFQFAKANGQVYLPGTVGAEKGEAGIQILHFLPTPQAPPGLGRAQRHFVEKRFDSAAKRPIDFELVRDRHLRNSARERDQAWSGALS
jgi:hypothetical protein